MYKRFSKNKRKSQLSDEDIELKNFQKEQEFFKELKEEAEKFITFIKEVHEEIEKGTYYNSKEELYKKLNTKFVLFLYLLKNKIYSRVKDKEKIEPIEEVLEPAMEKNIKKILKFIDKNSTIPIGEQTDLYQKLLRLKFKVDELIDLLEGRGIDRYNLLNESDYLSDEETINKSINKEEQNQNSKNNDNKQKEIEEEKIIEEKEESKEEEGKQSNESVADTGKKNLNINNVKLKYKGEKIDMENEYKVSELSNAEFLKRLLISNFIMDKGAVDGIYEVDNKLKYCSVFLQDKKFLEKHGKNQYPQIDLDTICDCLLKRDQHYYKGIDNPEGYNVEHLKIKRQVQEIFEDLVKGEKHYVSLHAFFYKIMEYSKCDFIEKESHYIKSDNTSNETLDIINEFIIEFPNGRKETIKTTNYWFDSYFRLFFPHTKEEIFKRCKSYINNNPIIYYFPDANIISPIGNEYIHDYLYEDRSSYNYNRHHNHLGICDSDVMTINGCKDMTSNRERKTKKIKINQEEINRIIKGFGIGYGGFYNKDKIIDITCKKPDKEFYTGKMIIEDQDLYPYLERLNIDEKDYYNYIKEIKNRFDKNCNTFDLCKISQKMLENYNNSKEKYKRNNVKEFKYNFNEKSNLTNANNANQPLYKGSSINSNISVKSKENKKDSTNIINNLLNNNIIPEQEEEYEEEDKKSNIQNDVKLENKSIKEDKQPIIDTEKKNLDINNKQPQDEELKNKELEKTKIELKTIIQNNNSTFTFGDNKEKKDKGQNNQPVIDIKDQNLYIDNKQPQDEKAEIKEEKIIKEEENEKEIKIIQDNNSKFSFGDNNKENKDLNPVLEEHEIDLSRIRINNGKEIEKILEGIQEKKVKEKEEATIKELKEKITKFSDFISELQRELTDKECNKKDLLSVDLLSVKFVEIFSLLDNSHSLKSMEIYIKNENLIETEIISNLRAVFETIKGYNNIKDIKDEGKIEYLSDKFGIVKESLNTLSNILNNNNYLKIDLSNEINKDNNKFDIKIKDQSSLVEEKNEEQEKNKEEDNESVINTGGQKLELNNKELQNKQKEIENPNNEEVININEEEQSQNSENNYNKRKQIYNKRKHIEGLKKIIENFNDCLSKEFNENYNNNEKLHGSESLGYKFSAIKLLSLNLAKYIEDKGKIEELIQDNISNDVIKTLESIDLGNVDKNGEDLQFKVTCLITSMNSLVKLLDEQIDQLNIQEAKQSSLNLLNDNKQSASVSNENIDDNSNNTNNKVEESYDNNNNQYENDIKDENSNVSEEVNKNGSQSSSSKVNNTQSENKQKEVEKEEDKKGQKKVEKEQEVNENETNSIYNNEIKVSESNKSSKNIENSENTMNNLSKQPDNNKFSNNKKINSKKEELQKELINTSNSKEKKEQYIKQDNDDNNKDKNDIKVNQEVNENINLSQSFSSKVNNTQSENKQKQELKEEPKEPKERLNKSVKEFEKLSKQEQIEELNRRIGNFEACVSNKFRDNSNGSYSKSLKNNCLEIKQLLLILAESIKNKENKEKIEKLIKGNISDDVLETLEYIDSLSSIDTLFGEDFELQNKVVRLMSFMRYLPKLLDKNKQSASVLNENRNNKGGGQNTNQLNNDKMKYNISTVVKKEDKPVEKEEYILINSNTPVKSNKSIKNNNTQLNNSNNKLKLLDKSTVNNNNISNTNNSQVKPELLNKIDKNNKITSKLLKMLTELELIEKYSSNKPIKNRKNKEIYISRKNKEIYISENEWKKNIINNNNTRIKDALAKLNEEINKYKTEQKLYDNIDNNKLVGLFASSKLEKLCDTSNIRNTCTHNNNNASNINKLSNDAKKEIKLKLSYRLADYINNVLKFNKVKLSKPSLFFCGITKQLATEKNCKEIKTWANEIKGKQSKKSQKQGLQNQVFRYS